MPRSPGSYDLTQPIGVSRAAEMAQRGFEHARAFARIDQGLKERFLGPYYGQREAAFNHADAGFDRPINGLYDFMRVTLPQLVARNPKVIVRAKRPNLDLIAEMHQTQLEQLMEEIQFTRVLRRIVSDALFVMGISYVGMANGPLEVEIDGKQHPIGQAFLDWISLDDFGVDPMARAPEEARWFSRKMLHSRSALLESGMFPPEAIEKVPEWVGQDTSDKRAQKSPLVDTDKDTDGDLIVLTEIYDCRLRQIITLGGVRDSLIVAPPVLLSQHEWYGPDNPTGPYNFLGFALSPDHFFPMGPSLAMVDMDALVNDLARKVIENFGAMKNLIVGPEEAREAMEMAMNSENNGVIAASGASLIKNVTMGGITEGAIEGIQWGRQTQSELGGNTDMLGGNMGADRKTATEAEILSANQNVRLSDMQGLKDSFVTDVLRKLSWYVWHDPLTPYPYTKRIAAPTVAGYVDIPIQLTPEMREGKWEKLNISVRAGTMTTPMDPMIMAKRRMEWASGVVPMAVQLYMETGGLFNAEAMILDTGRDLELENIDRYWNGDLARQVLLHQQAMAAYPPPPGVQAIMGMMGQGGGVQVPGAQPAAPAGGRKPGMPGSAAMPGAPQTGSKSPAFDRSANTQQTVATVRGKT